ncbi:MAG: GNAT family N-acetyltransferase [Dehalococcoidia bacterium]
MPIEFRQATAAEMPAYIYTDRVGFGGSTAPDELERALERTSVTPEMTYCAFEGGTAVSIMATLPFTMRWNGRDIGCGGVTDVATLPSHRRQGLLRELMTRSFAKMRDDGQPVAMLWASMAAIYQRFGYGVAYTTLSYDVDPRHLRFVDDLLVAGRTRLVEASKAVPLIEQAYSRFTDRRTLMLRRTAENWKWALERNWQPAVTPWLVVTYEEHDEVLGYAVYGVESRRMDDTPGPNQRLHITDFVWLTPAAHRAIVRHLAGYDLAYSLSFIRLPIDDPLLYAAQEPRLLRARASDGTLVRIVDLPAALEARGYDADGRVSFSLADDLCPWNAGTWMLTVDGGRGIVTRSESDAAICLTPRALAVLASGRLSATSLATMGQLSAADPRVLRTADALFATASAPLCIDMF